MRLLDTPTTISPAIACSRRETFLPAARAPRPERLLAELTELGVRGVALWHSAGTTLLATRPLLRLTLRCAVVTVEPLVDAAAPLRDALAERTELRVATGFPPTGLPDAER